MVNFRASGIGNCLPELVCSIIEPDVTSPPEDRKYFLGIGHALQPVVEEFLTDSGLRIKIREAPVELVDEGVHLTGHIDAIAINEEGEEILVEIKCITSKKWHMVKDCKDWRSIYPSYYAQVQAYMGMSKIHKCLMVFMNRDTAEIILGYNYNNSVYKPDCLVEYAPEIFMMHLVRLSVAATWVVAKSLPDKDLCDSIGFCYFCRIQGKGHPYVEDKVVTKVDNETRELIKDRRSLRKQMFAVNKKLLDKFNFYDTEKFRVNLGRVGNALLTKFEVTKKG